MKKTFLFSLILLSSCVGGHTPEKENEVVLLKTNNLTYFKDLITGLCYSESGIRTSNNYAFTCVPCDSIKKLKTNK